MYYRMEPGTKNQFAYRVIFPPFPTPPVCYFLLKLQCHNTLSHVHYYIEAILSKKN
jgi:hypothetical protein